MFCVECWQHARVLRAYVSVHVCVAACTSLLPQSPVCLLLPLPAAMAGYLSSAAAFSERMEELLIPKEVCDRLKDDCGIDTIGTMGQALGYYPHCADPALSTSFRRNVVVTAVLGKARREKEECVKSAS